MLMLARQLVREFLKYRACSRRWVCNRRNQRIEINWTKVMLAALMLSELITPDLSESCSSSNNQHQNTREKTPESFGHLKTKLTAYSVLKRWYIIFLKIYRWQLNSNLTICFPESVSDPGRFYSGANHPRLTLGSANSLELPGWPEQARVKPTYGLTIPSNIPSDDLSTLNAPRVSLHN